LNHLTVPSWAISRARLSFLGLHRNKKAAPCLPGGASIKTKPTFYCPLSIPHSTRTKGLQMVGKPDTMIGSVL
jgi:hypothetical protein